MSMELQVGPKKAIKSPLVAKRLVSPSANLYHDQQERKYFSKACYANESLGCSVCPSFPIVYIKREGQTHKRLLLFVFFFFWQRLH